MPALAEAVTPCRGQDLRILTGGVARCCGLNHRLFGWQASGLRSLKGEAQEAVKLGCRGTRFYLGFNRIAVDFPQSLDLRFLAQLHRYGLEEKGSSVLLLFQQFDPANDRQRHAFAGGGVDHADDQKY